MRALRKVRYKKQSQLLMKKYLDGYWLKTALNVCFNSGNLEAILSAPSTVHDKQ